MALSFKFPIMVRALTLLIALMLGVCGCKPAFSKSGGEQDLPSWNEGPVKQSIIDFVKAVTNKGSDSYVPLDERIATFDNDGTLWCEMPCYPQLVFIMDRVRELAKDHPDYITTEPFRAAYDGDIPALASVGSRGATELLAATHSGMTSGQFHEIAGKWIATARQPRFKALYTELVYQPMLEVLAYLRKNGFKTFIVSGGGQEFMRPWTERVYGIPPQQVTGSSVKVKYQLVEGKAELLRLPEIDAICDGDQKPVCIQRAIGLRPIAAFGNSDGDLAMLQWTTSGPGKRLALLVHHTDSEREYAYDRTSKIGHLEKALDEANSKHWTVVDMKTDWKKVFPFDK